MTNPISRRELFLSAAGACALAQESPLQLGARQVEITLTPVTRTTVRITVQPIENGSAVPVLATGALVEKGWPQPAARLRSLTTPRTVQCGDLTVKLSNSPLAIRVEAGDGRMIQEFRLDASTGGVTFPLGEGHVFGLGQGGPQFDRKGQLDKMGSGQGGYKLGTHGAKVPVQLAIGTSGWAMFIHQPVGAFDLTGKEGLFQPAHPETSLPLDMFVIGAKDPASVMGEYAKITGLPEMAPLWAFGYQQSHRTLGPPEEILEEARKFRDKKLPCDAMIYLGTGFCPNGWNTDNGEFTWNKKVFPDPKATIDALHKENLKVVLHIVVEGRKLTGTVSDPCTATPLPTGRTEDKKWPPDRQASCYWPAHKPLLDLGIDGWWPDQGDGLDAPSRLARNRMYFEGHQMYRPNERVYALHRNSYAGMQRYASFLWSGDILSTWETLKNHVPIGINTGLSGMPYWGTDIGGFVPTKDYTGELFARWFQFAAFNPLFRSHGRDWRLHMPWGWNTGEIGYPETPSYHPEPAEIRDASIEPICKKYLELRYQLMPYLYSAVKETCETGVPIIRAMWLHYPQDATAVARGDQYLYGRDILVAPVVEKGATSRSVYLPAGIWYDFWSKEKLAGGREIARKVDLETIPLYVRAGAILPMGPVKQYTGEKVDAPLNLYVHPGADGAFSLYEDDGRSFDFRKGAFSRINIAWSDSQRKLSVRLAKGSRMLDSTSRKISVQVVGESPKHDVVFKGRSLEVKL
jgi:alpha-glucosidase (family GH31 glycosyl hydrolase)